MLSYCLNTKMDCFIIFVTISDESVHNYSELLCGFSYLQSSSLLSTFTCVAEHFQVLTYCVILLLDRVSYVLTICFSGIWQFLVVMFLHSLETLRFHLSNLLQILPMFPSSPFNVLFQVHQRFKYFYLVPLHFACSLTIHSYGPGMLLKHSPLSLLFLESTFPSPKSKWSMEIPPHSHLTLKQTQILVQALFIFLQKD